MTVIIINCVLIKSFICVTMLCAISAFKMERNTENIESYSSSSVQKQDTDEVKEDEFLVEIIKLENMEDEITIDKVKIESKMIEAGLLETSQNNDVRHSAEDFSADKNLVKDVKLEVMDDYVEVSFANPLEEDEPGEITVNCSKFKNVESEIGYGAFANTSEKIVPVNIENYRAQLEEKSLNCAECEQYFVTKIALLRHLESHFGSNINECIQCADVLTQSDRFNKISFKCGKCQNKCSLCNSVVGNYSSALKTHMRTHTGVRPFACPHCVKTFTRKGNLNLHVRKHNGERPFTCPHCVKTFVEKSTLKLHVRTHTGERPFACPHCVKMFVHSSALKLHIRTHTGERPYTCPHCVKTFAQKVTLEVHLRTHNGDRPFTCPHCVKTFVQKGTLEVHLRTHIKERSLSCPHCVKTFTRKGNLSLHIRKHTGERPFACPHCVKTFVHKGILTVHLRSHTGERPFACPLCEKTFVEKRDLTFHIKYHS